MRSIHDPRYQDLIKKLIELRESKDMTQVELAQRLGSLNHMYLKSKSWKDDLM